jgi:chromosome segregation ATPase
MKQVLTKDDVKKAINDLIAQKKKTPLNAIHAALGHRGSMSTLVKLKAEIDAEAMPATDSAEGLKAFREVWALAVEEGRQQQNGKLLELEENLASLAAENERLEGAALAADNRATEAGQAQARLEAELGGLKNRHHAELEQAHKTLAANSAQLAAALQKLADMQVSHAQESADMQAKLAAAVQRAHEFEMQVVRKDALLEAKGGRPAKTGQRPNA